MAKKDSIEIKTKKEIKTIQENGQKMAEVKNILKGMVKEGVSAWDLEKRARQEIAARGGFPSFMTVPNYKWATCININEGIVHGIPRPDVVFRDKDVVSVDLGMLYKGFHTDTSFSVLVGQDKKRSLFLAAGEKALREAIKKTVAGNRIYDISEAIESTLIEAGYRPVEALVGHGVGRSLHEEPAIPGFVASLPEDTPILKSGMVLAIEVIYVSGSIQLVLEEDGWTIATQDGKISALFEDTVAVTSQGPLVIT